MLTTTVRQNSLSLSGGHIVVDQLLLPSYSPNAVSANGPNGGQSFTWEDDVNEINTPDIDPSFFDGDPFKKYNMKASIDMMTDEQLFSNNQIGFGSTDDSTQQTINQSMEENFDLSQLINQTNPDINGFKESQTMVSMDEVLENHYIPATTAPVLHYLQPRPVQSVGTTVESVITTNTYIDSIPSHSMQESLTHFSSPSSQSSTFSTINQSYLSPSPSPALSFTSSSSNQSTVLSMDAITSDSSITIDGLLETKPDPDFLQPTVIDDHLYTLPSTSSKSKKSSEPKEKYLNVRKKNNIASKKSRVTKKDKQKLMEEQIQHYIDDNASCKKQIERMEREIEWCKSYLFKKVVSSARS